MTMQMGWRVGCAIAVLTAAACSGDSTPAPTNDPPAAGTVITVTSSGASPRNIIVARGTQVTFVNNDGIVHEMFSDPHPEHNECPEFDSVGRLSPGQSRQTTNLVDIRTCRFHDHLYPENNNLKGTVTIQIQ